MWWLDAVADGFGYPAASLQVCLFRVVLAVAVVAKFGYEHYRGAWHWFDPGCYVRYRYGHDHPRARIGQRGYRVFYVAKLVAAVCLLVGVLPQLAAFVLGCWFMFELRYDRKFHTTYLGLCSLFLAASPALGDALTWHTWLAMASQPPHEVLAAEAARTHTDVFAQVLVVLLTVQMYLSSAFRKVRSRQFMSGAALHDFTRAMHTVRDDQPHRETWYPRVAVGLLVEVPAATARRRWRPAAVATVALEAALPFALLVPVTYPVAVLAGAAMHVVFAALLPVRLPPYSLATVGAYLLFVDPRLFASLL